MVVSDIPPGDMQHPAGKGLLQFALRILTRRDEIVVDFGEFEDLISWRANLLDGTPPGSYDFTIERGEARITEIPSPVAGRVTRSEVLPGYGNVVEIRGNNGYTWFLAHLDRRDVTVGQTIQRGETIGNQGFSGRVIPAGVDGSHVHVEISHPQQGAGNPYNRVTDRAITQPMIEEYLGFLQRGGD